MPASHSIPLFRSTFCGLLAVGLIVTSAVLQNELISSTSRELPGPFLTHYVMVAISTAVSLPLLLVARFCLSSGPNLLKWRSYYLSLGFWCGAVFPLFLLGGFEYWSLKGTTPSAQNTISQTNVAFVFVFQACLKRTRCSVRQISCATLSVSGAGLVAYAQRESSGRNTWWGIAFAFAAAASDAIYSIATEHLLEINDDGAPASLCQVILKSLEVTVVFGIPSLATTWPFLIALYAAGFEHWQIPSGKEIQSIFMVWPWLFCYGMGFNTGVYWTNAAFMVLGGAMVIPVNIVIDAVGRISGLTLLECIGAMAIMGSFAMLPRPTLRQPLQEQCVTLSA